MQHPHRTLSGLAWVLAAGLAISTGCGSSGDKTEELASGSLAVVLPDGSELASVNWTISGGALTDALTGTIDVGEEGDTISTQVVGIPVGFGYTVELDGTTSEGATCSGAAPFDIPEADAIALASVTMNCGSGDRDDGDVVVDGEVNQCPIVAMVVSPLSAHVGDTIDLSASASDTDGDALSYTWSASGGSIANASAANTVFTCTAAGTFDVELVIDDGHDCDVTRTARVTCTEDDDHEHAACEGNISFDDIPEGGSVGFIIVDGRYEFFQQPGMNDTSISFVDSNCEFAYGWSRDKPYTDDTAVQSSWRLNLATMEFETIDLPGAVWTILRNGREDGVVVGKVKLDSGTPDDDSDDVRRGFVHNTVTGETEFVDREGFFDIGFSGISDNVVVGFNDFGMQGFVYDNGVFTDLDHPDAFRLFPFQVNNAGTVVGFWGTTEDNWYDNTVNPAFVAEPSGAGYSIERYELAGFAGTGLTGVNDSGQIAGLAYASPTSLPMVFEAASADATVSFRPLAGDLEAFPTGISNAGNVYGQVYILEEPPACGGHGTPDGDTCICEYPYEVDPYDQANCVLPDAECSGHGHTHGPGTACHCDSGYRTDPDDPSQCIPN